ncbi:response regulator [Mucilaginibacter limnophilus]|uniref:histidine kinase n=1 Tax=Mucilaginibacter limnophilus TaxID=1932778 RepID=A0A437MRU0_9SPHI|nr:response regulator [Mucilaginibacter limnophilus]RVU00368.1 response regulator [Mucilaginibacter limnophilus]
MKQTLTRNLQIGFGFTLLLLIISSVLSYVSIQNLLTSSDMVDHSNQVVAQLESIMSTMKDAETGQRGFLLTGKDEFLEPYKGAYGKALTTTNKVLGMTTDNPRQQANVNKIKNILLKRLDILQDILDQRQKGLALTVEELRKGRIAMDELRQAISTAETEERSLLAARVEKLQSFTGLTPLIIIFAAILSVVVSVFSYLKVTADMSERMRLQRVLEIKEEEVSRRLEIIRNIAGKIAAGDYGIRVDDHEKDDLGSLALALNRMAESLQTSFTKLTDNEWLQTGISKLNEEMIGEKDVPVLAADILKFLMEYTRSQVGALYTRNNGTLTLESSFGVTDIPAFVKVGEGIAGQAAANDQEIWLKDIAEDQLVINHVGGGIKTKNILAIPIHHEKQVKGVIELATIYEYPPRKLDFLHNVSGNIGLSLNAAENRKKLQELLEETQAQSEELQAQHSELENVNTELEAHTQKLQASEEELRVQQEELQQANNELQERNSIIQERNLEIQKKAEELEQSTRYKSEFMANMSHELRTPLNSILLLSRYLSENNENNLNEEQIESANVILNSGNGLLKLIDELLDLSKIEAGKMELEYQRVQVNDLLSGLQAMFVPVAREKNLAFVINNELGAAAELEIDRMRLEQILKNLIANALKFTSTGQISVSLRPSEQHPGFVDFSVTDTGIGIPKEKQHLVFDAFQQADGSTKRKFGGTGLGLSISRQLARLLGGDISLVSEPEKGSTFTVTIPADRTVSLDLPVNQLPEVETPVNIQSTPTANKFLVPVIPEDIPDDREGLLDTDKTVLIVEDDTAFAKSLLKFTRQRGYKGIVAVRGDQALELAQHYRPVAILLDIQLPVKDGWEVMEELKTDPATRHIPVHIMSSLDARKESRMKGAINFINKPIAIEQMKQIFHRLEEALSKGPKKVLIVEENNKHAEALAFFLETFNVSSAVSGNVSDSIKTLQEKEVECVIMDMGIPGQNAYETLETVKKSPGLEDLPIIVFTGKNLSAGEEQRIRQYADTIVVKTAHSYQRILDEVALFLHLVEENRKGGGALEKDKKLMALNEVLEGKTVLIADDDVRNIFSLTRSLEKYGMKVISATDGKEALQQLEQHKETNVVLMDMMMPEMDGYESTTRIRQHPDFKHIPVIAVTAKAMLGDREKCISAGASDYISKPVDIDQLISLLRVWLYQK